MEKVLSVIIPTYNMEKYINRCLDSLIVDEKHMGMLDVLVIIDGSKDGSSAIAHEYEDRYPNTIRVIDKENGNYGSCINRGVLEAVGKYVKVLDADDYYVNLTNYLDFISLYDCDVVFSNTRTITRFKTGDSKHALPDGRTFKPRDVESHVAQGLFMHSITYRLSMIKEMGYKQTEGISYTDLEWSYYPMSKATSMRFYHDILYVYDMSRDGQTVQPETHCKSMWMEMNVVKKMVDSYASTIGETTEESMEYVNNRLYGYLKKIYDYYLISYPNILNIKDLEEFDQLVEGKLPALHDKLLSERMNRRLFQSFQYIKVWSRYNKRSGLKYILFDIYSDLGNRRAKCRQNNKKH